MKTTLKNIRIVALTAVIPENKFTFSHFEQKIGRNELLRIIKSTGIQSVRAVPESLNFIDMASITAEHLLKNIAVNRDDIDAIIVISQTVMNKLPAASCILQNKLQLRNDTLAFDISYGCSGYIYGLYQAAMLIHAEQCQRVLVITGDIITRHLNQDDHHVRLVLGDAFSATLLEAGQGDIPFVIKTDGAGAKNLCLNAGSESYLHMNGAAIMEFALREVPPAIEEVLKLKNWGKIDVGCFALHQANQFIINYLQRKMQLKTAQVPVAVNNVGNTGPASIPLMLTLKGKSLQDEHRLEKTVLCGFGAGLSWGACAVDLSQTLIIPVKEVRNVS